MAYVFDFSWLAGYGDVLISGVWVTVYLILIGATLAAALGIVCAWARALGPAWLKPVVGAYVELIRNTPFLIQLFFIFLGLPVARPSARRDAVGADRDGGQSRRLWLRDHPRGHPGDAQGSVRGWLELGPEPA